MNRPNDQARANAVNGPSLGGDPVPKALPPVFRLQSIERLPGEPRSVLNRAVLFHERASLCVSWISATVDTRLHIGCLVSVRWLGRPISCAGTIQISRLVPMQHPQSGVNVFDTIPTNWVRERTLVARAQELVGQLDPPMQALVNTVFWDGGRFQRFLVGPSSLNGHHNGLHGNLIHSIEVAEQAGRLAQNRPGVAMGTLIAAALLHDAGKSDEYRFDSDRNRFVISDRGALIGHRNTLIEWLGEARLRCPIPLKPERYISLLHALTAVRGAPSWLGLREPCSEEAVILSTADRMSGQMELMDRQRPAKAGFGRFHSHLGMRPFVPATEG